MRNTIKVGLGLLVIIATAGPAAFFIIGIAQRRKCHTSAQMRSEQR
jgi:hypothetical protein